MLFCCSYPYYAAEVTAVKFVYFNPFTADPVKSLHFAILISPTIFNFWHLGALVLSAEHQSARMSKIKTGGLDQHGAELFEQQQFQTAGIEGINIVNNNQWDWAVRDMHFVC